MPAFPLGSWTSSKGGLLALLVSSGNPFFGVVLVFVLIGIALTGTSYVLDRRDEHRRAATA